MTRLILYGVISVAVTATTPMAQANSGTEFSSFDEARIYFEPWETLHVLAMTPERLVKAAPVSIRIVGLTQPARLAERILVPERADATAEATRDVRLVVEFYHGGVVKRTAYATYQTLYDGSGRAIRDIDSSFRRRFSALTELWEGETTSR